MNPGGYPPVATRKIAKAKRAGFINSRKLRAKLRILQGAQRMRGISEERLREIANQTKRFDDITLLNRLVKNECTELNPWLPIDEKTPRDRLLQLGRLDGFQCVGRYIPQFGHWVDQNQSYVVVTHYQELPEAPL